ncbi:hypothetical protein [Verrucomicrobium sp. BvORR106]|uniref:hypothetical protein n=1 Tax=Verrucomicrobium sp. BvORR106 TaxID=1403819 RepID=UPI00056FF6E6|nr:hypothetical protein [Verrucomicrobium sp. BvORR106]
MSAKYLILCSLLGLGAPLLPAKTPAEELVEVEERYAQDKPEWADSIVREILGNHDAGIEWWKKAIEAQVKAGRVVDAANNAEVVMLRCKGSALQAEGKAIYEGVLRQMEAELDRFLAFKSWGDVDKGARWFRGELAKLMRRMVRVNPAKTRKALALAATLVQQSPEEVARKQSNRPRGSYSDFLAQLGNTPELADDVFRLADKDGLIRDRTWVSSYESFMSSQECWRDASHVRAVFSSTPFVAEAKDFRDFFLGDSTLIGMLINRLKWSDDRELKGSVLRDLAARKPRAFGAELVETMLVEDSQGTLMKEFLARRKQDLSLLSPQSAAVVVALIASKFNQIAVPVPLSPEWADRMKPLLEAESKYLEEVMTPWRKEAVSEVINRGYETALDEASWIFRRTACRDQEKAVLFLEQAVKLAGAHEAAFGDQFSAALMRKANSIPETLARVMKIAEREGLGAGGGGRSGMVSAELNLDEVMRDPQRLVAYLDAAGLLGDVKKFTAAWRPDEPFEHGVVKRLATKLPGRKDAADGVCKLLAQRQPRTFGTEVVLMLLTPAGDLGLPQVLRDYQGEISALPADLQEEMARFGMALCRDLGGLAQALPNSEAALKARQAEVQSAATQDVEKILNATDPKKYFAQIAGGYPYMRLLTSAPSEEMVQMTRSLAIVAEFDAKKAGAALKKYTEMLAAADPMRVEPDQRINFSSTGPWLAACLGNPRLLRWVNEAVLTISRVENYYWNKCVEDSLFPDRAFASLRTTVQLLKNHELLVAATDFAPMVWGRRRSTLQMVVTKLRNQPPALKDELVKHLQSRGTLNFGETVIVAACLPNWKSGTDLLRSKESEMALLSPPVREMVQELLGASSAGGGPGGAPPTTTSTGGGSSGPPAGWPGSGSAEETVSAEGVEKYLGSGDLAGAAKELDTLLAGASPGPVQEPHLVATFNTNASGAPKKIEALLKQPGNVRTAGLLLARLQADHDGTLGVPGPTTISLMAAALEGAWMRSGGLVEPVAATKGVLSDFTVALKEGQGELPSTVYLEFLKRLPDHSRQAVLAWAEKTDAGSPQHAQAQAMVAAWSLKEGASGRKRSGGTGQWERISQFVNNPAASARARFGVAAYWCREAPEAVPATVVVPAARLGLQFWARDEYFHEPDLSGVLIRFGAAEGGKEWDDVAGQFQSEWERRTFAMKNGRSRSNNMDAIHASISILARMGRETDLDLMFETYKYSVAEDLWPVALMVQQGMIEAAASRLRGNWAVLTGVPLGSAKTPLLPMPSPERVAAFVKAFGPGEKELALLAEQVLLSGGVVRQVDRSEIFSGEGEQRMENLAQRAAEMPVTDRKLRRVLHARIVQASPKCLSILAAHIKEDVSDAVLNLESYGPSRAGVWPVEVMAMDAALKVLARDDTAVSENLQLVKDAIRRKPSLGSATREIAMGAYLLRVMECVAHEVPNLAKERRKALFEPILLELKRAENITPGSGLHGAHWLVMWWMEGTGQEVVGLPSVRSTFRSQADLLGRVRLIMQRMVGKGDSRLPQPDRIKLMMAAMNRPEFQADVTPQGNVSPALESLYFLLSPEEILQFGSELSAGCKTGGRKTYEMAMIAMSQGKDDTALALLKLAENEVNVGPNGEFRYAPRSAMRKPPPFFSPPRPGTKIGWSTEWVYEEQVVALLRLHRNEDAAAALNTVADAPFLTPMKAGLAKIVADRAKP